jgi:hypothetical protein
MQEYAGKRSSLTQAFLRVKGHFCSLSVDSGARYAGSLFSLKYLIFPKDIRSSVSTIWTVNVRVIRLHRKAWSYPASAHTTNEDVWLREWQIIDTSICMYLQFADAGLLQKRLHPGFFPATP